MRLMKTTNTHYKPTTMREIKFRAWNGKRMIYIGRNDTCIVLEGNRWEVVDHFTGVPTLLFNNDSGKLMQYTELKDKNGKEIYEGDIYEVALNKRYVVPYHQGVSNFEWYGGAFLLYKSDDMFFPFDEYAIKHGTVIGNIHENPEFLNK